MYSVKPVSGVYSGSAPLGTEASQPECKAISQSETVGSEVVKWSI